MPLLFFSVTLFAQKTEQITHNNRQVPRLETKHQLDGLLNEACWNQALKIPLSYEVDPGENIPAPVKTDVYLFHDHENLYIGFIACDPEPHKIRYHYKDRDQTFSDDWVGVILDTYNDQRRAFDFFCNPIGIQSDAIETDVNFDDSWDAIWKSKGQITDTGFSVEMVIPFRSFRFQKTKTKQVWRFDAVRSYPREVRHHIGTFPRDRDNNCYFCQAIPIEGFEGIENHQSLELNPTLIAHGERTRRDETRGPFYWKEKSMEPSLTAKWSVSPNLTLSGTLNPDFSQVEADAALLDINEPFALWFPEKRPFFTEGKDFFQSKIDAIYTRSLRNPIWGAKISGKENGNTIGAYTVRDEITNLLFPSALCSDETSLNVHSQSSVLRYKHDFGNKYTGGVLLTDRQSGRYLNRVYGGDGTLRLSNKDKITFQLLGSTTQYPDSVAESFNQKKGKHSGHAIEATYQHNSRNLDYYLNYEDYHTNFRADQGFVPRVGYRLGQVGMDYSWYAEKSDIWWSQVILNGEYLYGTSPSGDLLLRKYEMGATLIATHQSHAIVEYAAAREFYDGQYFNQKTIFLHHCMRPFGNLQLWLNLRLGDRIDYTNSQLGKRVQFSPGIEVNLGKHLLSSISYVTERMKVRGNHLYTANILNSELIYHFTSRMFMRSILQYRNYRYNLEQYDDDREENPEDLFVQFLFSYKINPQTMLFLGYSTNFINNEMTPLTATNRGLFMKIGYAFNL